MCPANKNVNYEHIEKEKDNAEEEHINEESEDDSEKLSFIYKIKNPIYEAEMQPLTCTYGLHTLMLHSKSRI